MFFRILRATATLCAMPVLLASPALACQFDTDCPLGNQCLKATGAIYGICGEGAPPGSGIGLQSENAPLDFGGTSANTCRSDTDCNPEASCLKATGSVYGVCGEDVSPGNGTGLQPGNAPLDLEGTSGNTCQFDIDCGLGSSCVKSSGIYGMCMEN